jgi:simple sugar transport system ATP-binding protein
VSANRILLEANTITKRFDGVVALEDVSIWVKSGHVTCLLGDNGAGKSTLIKILSGVFAPDAGSVKVDGTEVRLRTPTDALNRGIATVFQDLALVPIMPIYRNFFLGREPTRGWGPFRMLDIGFAQRIALEQLRRIGINVSDAKRTMATLSGGERQSVAIAIAVYFGAKVLILDEPTAALGVKEAALVLRYVRDARKRGLGVIFISHNVHHAYAVGDTFTILERGHLVGTFTKAELQVGGLTTLMAGGEELQRLEDELTEGGEADLLQEADTVAEGKAPK